jgi:predicted lactoylglutathione lyase
MSRTIFVNLPVADVAASTRFYESMGCARNPQFSNEKASSMVWSDSITFQLMSREYFSTFIPLPVADARRSCQTLLVLTRDSRAEVDAMIAAASAAGGKADPRKTVDFGWLYNRAFTDLDGHWFEAAWVDVQGMPRS